MGVRARPTMQAAHPKIGIISISKARHCAAAWALPPSATLRVVPSPALLQAQGRTGRRLAYPPPFRVVKWGWGPRDSALEGAQHGRRNGRLA